MLEIPAHGGRCQQGRAKASAVFSGLYRVAVAGGRLKSRPPSTYTNPNCLYVKNTRSTVQ